VLHAAGYDVVLICLAEGSTLAQEWVPTAADVWSRFEPEFQAAYAALQAMRPGETYNWIHVRDQGTSDMRLGTGGGFPAIIDRWAEDTQLFHEAVEAIIGQSMTKICWLSYSQLTQAGSSPPVANWAAEIRAQQLEWAPAPYHIDGDGIAELESDTVHYTSAGYITMGELIAAKIQELFPMGSMATGGADAALKHELNNAAYSPPATHYFHLYAGGVALTGFNSPGYVAASATNNTTTWPTPASRAVSNGVEITFPTPSADWLSADEVRVTDNATEGAGTVLGIDTFPAMPATDETGPIKFAVGDLTFTMSAASGFVDAVAERMLGLIFGGTTYAASATTYLSYWAGDPQGAGAQAGSRVAITKATGFNAASGGKATTASDITLTQQATGTYVAFHDAAAAGNLEYSAARPASVGSTGTIRARQLRIAIT
jgi:hypothetical protein